MIHQLKCEKQFFEPVMLAKKTCEVRKNDRNFRCGDLIGLNEVVYHDSKNAAYTGRSMLLEITHILSDERFVKEGFVVLSFELLDIQRQNNDFFDDICEGIQKLDFRCVTKEYEIVEFDGTCCDD